MNSNKFILFHVETPNAFRILILKAEIIRKEINLLYKQLRDNTAYNRQGE